MWFQGNGGYIDGVKLVERDGLRGLIATKALPPYKAIIAVPNKIVISAKLAERELKEIFTAYPHLYDSDTNAESEYNKLALFVFAELLKGEKSFYHHFFKATPTCDTIIEWSREELEALGDPYILNNGLQF